MKHTKLIGGTIIDITSIQQSLWSIRVKCVSGEIIEIETGDDFTPLVSKVI